MDTPKRFNKQNYLGIIILIIIVAVLAYRIGISNRQPQVVSPPSNVSEQQNQTTNMQTTKVYDYTEAPNHIGEYAGIRGRVVQVYTSRKGTIFFDYSSNYRNCPFSAVIFASSVKNFENMSQYENQEITVTGQIKSYQGKAEIILNSPNQISR